MDASGSVLYLDTNHLSRLGREPGASDSLEVSRALTETGSQIALSLIHLIELSEPTFKSAELVASRLDELPVVWALSPDDLWEAEVRSAFAAAVGSSNPVQAFGNDLRTALGGTVQSSAPSEALRAFREPALRAEIQRIVVDGILFDRLKTTATLVQEPLKLLKGMIASRQPSATPAGINLPTPLSPKAVLQAVGGLEGFPSYGLMHKVATARQNDTQFQAKDSDVFDLMQTAYAPYARITALDRSYAARVRAARPSLASRVTHRLDEVSSMLRGLEV